MRGAEGGSVYWVGGGDDQGALAQRSREWAADGCCQPILLGSQAPVPLDSAHSVDRTRGGEQGHINTA